MSIPAFDFEAAYARFDEINKTRALTNEEVNELAKLVEKEKRRESTRELNKRNPERRREILRQWRFRNPSSYRLSMDRKNAKRNEIRQEEPTFGR